MADITSEPVWARVLRLGAQPLRDIDALTNEIAWLDLEAEGEEDEAPGEEDVKAMLRLAQDLLKYKQEQVNVFLGEIEKLKSESSSKRRKKMPFEDSPTHSDNTPLETLVHQEEEIRANKEILERLYADIAELEGRKKAASEKDVLKLDRDSNSSREPLSERDAVRQLEDQLTAKNKHIRKMLTDIKVLEEENRMLKEKVSVVKNKLSEATQFIQSLTGQVWKLKSDCSALKETIGKTEEEKVELKMELDLLKKKLNDKVSNNVDASEEMQAKLLHWKNNAKSRKAEVEKLQKEILRLKCETTTERDSSYLSNQIQERDDKIKELQEKLSEASEEIIDSVKLIESLKSENINLKSVSYNHVDTFVDSRIEKNHGMKNGLVLNKMKQKVNNLTTSLKAAEEMLAVREQELAEVLSQLKLIEQGEEGVQALLKGLKNKKRQLKHKDVDIKSLVQDVNELSQIVDGLQMENEAMRHKLNIDPEEVVPTKGVLAKFYRAEKRALNAEKKIRQLENMIVNIELEARDHEKVIIKLKRALREFGCDNNKIHEILDSNRSENDLMPSDGGGESSAIISKKKSNLKEIQAPMVTEEMNALIEENEGLRKGMTEILEFLKTSDATTSTTLAVQCPSLEKILYSLDARHSAGWYAPHMAAVMGLQAAIGGRDALLTALNDARKETWQVMEKLSKEVEQCTTLKQKLEKFESKSLEQTDQHKPNKEIDVANNIIVGAWMSDKDSDKINLFNESEIKDMTISTSKLHEQQLKAALLYFHKQFDALYKKMTTISVQTTNDHNKWSIKEEKYKAEIISLKAQIAVNDDASEISEGIVATLNSDVLARKCTYLEDSYRYIRTLNENLKNESFEKDRQHMMTVASFESKVQGLILSIVTLTDQLRKSVSLKLFLKQNEVLNDCNLKYRKLLNDNAKSAEHNKSLEEELLKQKSEILEYVKFPGKESDNLLQTTEISIIRQQLSNLCSKYEEATKNIKHLEDKNVSLQISQQKFLDTTLSLSTKEEYEMLESQLEKCVDENKSLKNQCIHVNNQLEVALSQLQDTQQRQMMNDLEVNMLRHQILDLQAKEDSKAVIARLSNEILIAHLHSCDMNKNLEKIRNSLVKENQKKMEAEEMIKAREKIFNVYAERFEAKFRFMYETMQTLRQQYQGSIPLVSLENYINGAEELSRKMISFDEKLSEVDDLKELLAAKTEIFNKFMENSVDCLINSKKCPHKIKLEISESVHSREIDILNSKIDILEKNRKEVVKLCNNLERTLVMVNQGFETSAGNPVHENSIIDSKIPLQVEDIPSEDEDSRRSQTMTLSEPKVLKPPKPSLSSTNDKLQEFKRQAHFVKESNQPGSPIKIELKQNTETTIAMVQTESCAVKTDDRYAQTESDLSKSKLQKEIKLLIDDNENKQKELSAALALASKRAENIISLEADKLNIDAYMKKMNETLATKETLVENLKSNIEHLKKEITVLKYNETTENKTKKDHSNEEMKSLLNAIKTLENEKNAIVDEYKSILKDERDEYANSIKDLQGKIVELQKKFDESNYNTNSESRGDNACEEKYSIKIEELENQCFKIKNMYENCKSELKSCQNELERWKSLASERLQKIEYLGSQFEEKHNHEMNSYRTENEHWLSQISEGQKEILELRSKLAEQRTLFLKQLTEKDSQIEHHKSTNQNLKSQILSLRSMMSASNPGFDLSAIVEVTESSDFSPHGSDRLEIRFHSTNDLSEHALASEEYVGKEPAITSPTWQETIVDRLRREKQVVSKQNSLLRRQIKVLAGRERRSRLEAQNLKTQMYRTSGNKSSLDASTTSLHNKVAALQSQLSSARRDSHAASLTAVWEKWKRAQQSAERWQARYDEKCLELNKMESVLNATKTAVIRLEKEKRILLTKISEIKSERHISFSKEVDVMTPKESEPESTRTESSHRLPPHITVQSLLDRVEAQQRRIAALELADKGQEPLISEYEKVLSQNTMLKSQILKLESQLLEAQLIGGGGSFVKDTARQSELEHLRSYCETLKEENLKLSAKVCSLSAIEGGSNSSAAHRINDLEQTVLTLRGLVSKLQAEQRKTSVSFRRSDLRAGSVQHSTSDLECGQTEALRAELSLLKRSVTEKDLLLERCRDLLKMAAEREEQLLKEITCLRQCLEGEEKKQVQ